MNLCRGFLLLNCQALVHAQNNPATCHSWNRHLAQKFSIFTKKMSRIFILSTLVFLFSCQDNSTRPEPASQDSSMVAAPTDKNENAALAGCYLRSLNRDTLVASLQQNGDSITGKLTFDNFEKDGSSGDVRGRIDSGIIKLIYSFRSEGMNSVMEVYFKVQGDSLLQGVGERTNHGDTVFFANSSAVTFQKRNPLKKTDCGQLDERFR